MFRQKFVVTGLVSIAAMALPAFSQTENPQNNEVTVQAFGSFVKSTTDNGVQNSATNSGGVLGSYRYFFNAHSGVEADYGYALNTENYGAGSGALGVKSYTHELSAAYVFPSAEAAFHSLPAGRRRRPHFDPKDFAGASAQGRAAFVYGGGADFNLSRRTFLRAEYRGFVYESPTYGLPGLAGADRVTHRAEPSIGFGFRY